MPQQKQTQPSFGAWLHALRDKLGLPQWKVGAEIGVDAQTYGKFEAQKRWPGPERLEKLAKLFGQPLKEVQARMALAKALADCGGDLETVAAVVQEHQAGYIAVKNLSATGETAGKKKK